MIMIRCIFTLIFKLLSYLFKISFLQVGKKESLGTRHLSDFWTKQWMVMKHSTVNREVNCQFILLLLHIISSANGEVIPVKAAYISPVTEEVNCQAV